MKIKKIVLIPAYEPTYKLIVLLNKLSKMQLDIIVVDDGSGGSFIKTFAEAEKYAKVLHYDFNRGKGYALKYGLSYINKNYNEDYIVVTMDADGQHSVNDALKLFDVVLNNRNTLVLGKRIRNKETPLKSKIGNGITRFIYHLITKNDIYDTQTGLRGFSNQLIEFMLQIEGDRFEYEMNVLLESAKNNIPIKEVEIETIYIDNNSGSHFNALKDSFLIYKQILKFSCSSLISFVIDYILYVIFLFLSSNLILSNVLSRCISASVNYTLNKKIVFKNKESTIKSALKYFLLAIGIMIVNSLILNFLVTYLSINRLIAKIITEVVLFLVSWIIQKNYIFNKGKV